MISACSLSRLVSLAVLAISTHGYNLKSPTGQYLNWSSTYPNGTATGRSGRVDYKLSWAGQNVPDENQSGGMTRRVVLAWDTG
jgi:hypothetical protein